MKVSEFVNENNKVRVGFKLLNLSLFDNPILGNLQLNFCDNLNDLQDFQYSTVIIGPNGTGKSNILKTIISIFRDLNVMMETGARNSQVRGKFSLTYILKGVKYSFGNTKLEGNKYLDARFSKGVWLLVNDQIEDDYTKAELPSNIVANSMMITDKYPYLKKDDFPSYTYLGVRSSRASSGTRAYVRKTVEIIKNSLKKPDFKLKIKEILKYLDLEEILQVFYKPIYLSEFYQDDITIEKFHDLFSNQSKYFPNRKTVLWGTNHYESIKGDRSLVSKIVTFLKDVSVRIFSQGGKRLTYDVLLDKDLEHDFEMIEQLTKLDLISFPSIDLKKQGSAFNLVDSSSGEYSLLSSLIGLMATVEENSLVFIDEPEVSLHPNWQMKYMHYLKEIFRGKKSCHFVIATHSHFLISDIEGVNSQVIGLKKEDGKLLPYHFEGWETYGWSAEEVLYKVFDVRTTRNHYLEMDLRKLLGLISQGSSNISEIESILSRIEKVRVDEVDPMNLIIKQAKEYLLND
jgi:predicted ATPase